MLTSLYPVLMVEDLGSLTAFYSDVCQMEVTDVIRMIEPSVEFLAQYTDGVQ